MSEITVYTFEDEDGTPDSFTTQDPAEAQERARKYRLRAVANTYEWADSETYIDCTDKES